MIDSIELFNFRKHTHTLIEFDKGMTAITGSNQIGKSTILEALCWVCRNRPTGDDYISHRARSAKGKQIMETRVIVRKGDISVERKRSETFNGYIIGDTEYSAIGLSVPDEVKKFFNLSTENIQEQNSPHFLLSETGSTIAKYFNDIIDLSIIDKAADIASTQVRTTKHRQTAIKDNLDVAQKEIEQLPDLQHLDALVEKTEEHKAQQRTLQSDSTQIECSINTIQNIEKQKSLIPNISDLHNKYESIINNKEKGIILDKEKQELKSFIDTVDFLYIELSKIPNISTLVEKYNQVEALYLSEKDIKQKIDFISEKITEYEFLYSQISKTPYNEYLEKVKEIENLLGKRNRLNIENNELIQKKRLLEWLTKQENALRGSKVSLKDILQLEAITEAVRRLSSFITETTQLEQEYKEVSQKLVELKAELPEICPFCNQTINKDII